MPDPTPATDPTPPNPLTGKTIARCLVAELIGKGHYAQVFRAHYEPLDKDIALKVLAKRHSSSEERRERFVQEARAIAQLDHEHIVRVLDVVEDQGLQCILMEYIAGETLRVCLKREGKLPPRKAVRIAVQMARALEAAHAAKIIHRDIKPGNVILTARAADVKVVDFGLAAQQQGAGTPVYMSPEAAKGKRIDEKSDVYALGVCLYQMLVGRPPYDGPDVKTILRAHVAAELVPPSEANPELGSVYDDVVKKLLVPSKGYRPTAAEAAELLQPLLEERGAAGGDRTRRGRRRTVKTGGPSAPVVVGIVGVALILAFGALLLANSGDDETPSTGGNPPTTPGDLTGTPTVQPPSTPTTAAPVVDTPTPADPAAEAYRAVEEWLSANPNEYEKLAARWEEVATTHPDSPLGRKAKMNALEAAGAAERQKDEAEREAKQAEFRARMQAERDEIAKRLAVYDFSGAMGVLQSHAGLPEESISNLRKKKWRVDFLAKEFLPRLNEGLQSGGRIRAQKLDPTAGAEERVVGIDVAGVLTDAGGTPRTIPWKSVKPDLFFDHLAKQVISQTKADGNLFLAILAAETGLPDRSKMHRKQIELVIDRDTADRMVKEYFAD